MNFNCYSVFWLYLILGIENNNRSSRPSTSRGCDDYANCHSFTNKNKFKANYHGVKHVRKSWSARTNLVHKQLDGEFSNRRNGPARNNNGQRYFIDCFYCLLRFLK